MNMNVTVKFNVEHALRLSYGLIRVEPDDLDHDDPSSALPTDQLALVIPLAQHLVARSDVLAYVQDGVIYWFDHDHQHIFQVGEVGNPVNPELLDLLVGDGALVLYEDVASAQVTGWGVIRARLSLQTEGEVRSDLLATYEQTAKLLAVRSERVSMPVRHAYVYALEQIKGAAEGLARQQSADNRMSDTDRNLAIKSAQRSLYVVHSLNANHLQ